MILKYLTDVNVLYRRQLQK